MIGKTTAPRRVLKRLGEGCMDLFCKAEGTKLKRRVVLKSLPPGVTGDLGVLILHVFPAHKRNQRRNNASYPSV